MTGSPMRIDESGHDVVALARAVTALGLSCAIEARGKLVLLLPAPESLARLAETETRRATLSLAREHGFTHVAIELPNDRRRAPADPDAPVLRD
ncbi:MAG: hypothetical protein ABIP93_15265 [Gemmatimonadaceae bacterium]